MNFMGTNPNSQRVINHIQKRKQDLITVFNSECCLCHFNEFPQALDFHHVDPSTKEFGVGASNAATKSLDKQLEEMKKCVLLCANCHRGVHAGVLQIPENYKDFYNEEIAQQLREKNEIIKHGQHHFCRDCGKEISRNKAYCPKCSSFHQRVVERPDRETLKMLIRTKSFLQIGKDFGVSDNTIRKWCKAVDLPSKKTYINSLNDEEWEKI